jgi:hypothetical protein
MDVIFAPLFVLILVLFAPFIALNAYLLVWLCGPAIRRAGKCWEEGRLKATAKESRWAPWGLVGDAPSEPRGSVTQDAKAHSATAMPATVAGAYDAGHRWLGTPGAKKG